MSKKCVTDSLNQSERPVTGTYCFWLSSTCGMLNLFFLAFFVHTYRSGIWAGFVEMINPITVGGVVVGGLMTAFLISIDRHLISVFLIQMAFVLLSYIGVLLVRLDFEGLLGLLKTMTNRNTEVFSSLASIVDSIPNGRLMLTFIAVYGLALYYCITVITKVIRSKDCVYARYSSVALCVFGLLLSFFFIDVGRSSGIGARSVTFGGIVEETLIQNRFLKLDEKVRDELSLMLSSGDVSSYDVLSTTPSDVVKIASDDAKESKKEEGKKMD